MELFKINFVNEHSPQFKMVKFSFVDYSLGTASEELADTA